MSKKKLGTQLNPDALDLTNPDALIQYGKIAKTLEHLKNLVHGQLHYFGVLVADFDPEKPITWNTTVGGLTAQFVIGCDQTSDHFVPVLVVIPFSITPTSVKHGLVEFLVDRKTGRLKNTAGLPDNKVMMGGTNTQETFRDFISGRKNKPFDPESPRKSNSMAQRGSPIIVPGNIN